MREEEGKLCSTDAKIQHVARRVKGGGTLAWHQSSSLQKTGKDTPEISVLNAGLQTNVGVSSARTFRSEQAQPQKIGCFDIQPTYWRLLDCDGDSREVRGNQEKEKALVLSGRVLDTKKIWTRMCRSFSVTKVTGRWRCTRGSTMSNGMHYEV